MKKAIRFWAILSGILLAVRAASQAPTLAPSAPWVKPMAADLTLKSGHEAVGGIVYLLFDVQANVEQHATYYHYAYRIVNSEGVQNMSDVSVDFDPSFQKLQFHRLLLYRNGNATNLLPTHRFETYRRETDAERFLYDGSISSTVNLKDVRVGDLLEVSYTITGEHPATGKKFTRTQDLSYTVPVSRQHFSVLTPNSRPLSISYNQRRGQAHRTASEGPYTRYIWDQKNLLAVDEEDDLPPWYTPQLSVTLTEYNNWAEVVQWALPLYQTTPEQLAKIKHLYGEKIDSLDDVSILKAIRFVQDEIRYLGFEMGMGGFKPNSPEKVFTNRFGDCKDKSMLLLTLLRSHGIEAYPMLVNSEKTMTLLQEAPSPHAFNHCVVYLRLFGSEYYVDPTLSLQGGTLNRLVFPRYHYGLILREGETELHRIHHDQRPTVLVREYFSLDVQNGPTDYRVVTEYDGAEADRMRAYIASTGTNNLAKSYLEYYQTLYTGVEQTEKPQINDDKRDESNALLITEHYSIKKGLWNYDDDQTTQATFVPSVIQGYLANLGSPKRSMPYYLGDPIEIIQEIEVRLPYRWPSDFSVFEVKNPAFYYTATVNVSGQTAFITYNYTVIEESVAPEAFAEFYENREETNDHLGYTLSNDKAPSYEHGPRGRDGMVLALAILGGGGFFVVCLVAAISIFLLYDPAPKPSPEKHTGIRGGLIAVAVGVILNPLFYFVDIILSMAFMTENAHQDSAGIILLRFMSFGIDIFLFVLSLLLLVYFFIRRTGTQTLFLIMFIVWILAAILNISVANVTDRNSWFYAKEVFRILFTCGLWLPFFILGDQVRGTFTKQLNPPKPPPTPWYPQNPPKSADSPSPS